MLPWWLLACSKPEATAPTRPQPAAEIVVTATLVALGADVRVMGPQGDVRMPFADEPFVADGIAPGATVQLVCTPEHAVAKVLPHQGLDIEFGTVARIDGAYVDVTSPLGSRSFALTEWSDMPSALVPGEYVGVKHFELDGGRAVLNTRRFPGKVVDVGVVVEAGNALTLRTLGGVRTFAMATSLQPGDLAAVTAEGVEPREPPLTFTGKFAAWNRPTFVMVDAHGSMLGEVAFRLDSCEACADLRPGDLVEVAYVWEAEAPTIRSMEKRALSSVYFGEITRISATALSIRTLQGQAYDVGVTPATRMPKPIVAGDQADVVWGGDPPVALLVVKE